MTSTPHGPKGGHDEVISRGQRTYNRVVELFRRKVESFEPKQADDDKTTTGQVRPGVTNKDNIALARFNAVALRSLKSLDADRLITHEYHLEVGTTGVGLTHLTDGEQTVTYDWQSLAAKDLARGRDRDTGIAVRERWTLTVRKGAVIAVEVEHFDRAKPVTTPKGRDLRAPDTLLRELGADRSRTMGNIVATIQADQDRLHRLPADTPLIIEGGPGTGKTVVGLHRLAVILYDLRPQDKVLKVKTMVVGPSRRYTSYIEKVLPGLGENDVSVTSFAELCLERLSKSSAKRFTWVSETSSLVERIKADVVVISYLRQVAWLPRSATPLRFRRGAISVSMPASDIDELLSGVRSRFLAGELSLKTARESVRTQLHLRVTQLLNDMAKELSSDESAERRRSRRERRRIEQTQLGAPAPSGPEPTAQKETNDSPIFELPQSHDKGHFEEAAHHLVPTIEPEAVVLRLFAPGSEAYFDDPSARLIVRELLQRPAQAPWTEADLPLIDEAAFIIGGSPTRFAHVVVDEAQDVSPMGWRVIARRVEGGGLTAVGDLLQRTSHGSTGSWSDGFVAAGMAQPTVETLRLSYRTPKQALMLARKVVAKEDRKQAPTGLREGRKPLMKAFASPITDETLLELISTSEVTESELVGVITIDERLRGIERLRPNTVVVPLSEMKGLEFDTVVLVEPGDWYDGSDRSGRLLYIALTRSTRGLIIAHHRELPESLRHRRS